MYLIVGLGNPESEYKNTRHNMGFDTINILSEKYGIGINKNKFNALIGEGQIEGKKVILIKPQTFMNLSGDSVIQFVNFYKVDIENVIVIYDDMYVEVGKIKVRPKGGPGSHNGMKSMIYRLGSENFPRIRVGIGKPQIENDRINYVIGPIPEKEREILKKATEIAAEAVSSILKIGLDNTMNKFN